MDRPRLLFVIPEGWFFASHFAGFARRADAMGFEVGVACPRHPRLGSLMAGTRITVFPAPEGRRHRVPSAAVAAAIPRLTVLMASWRPHLVHAISLRSVASAGIAARLARVPAAILAPTGLGHAWCARGPLATARRAVLRAATAALRGPRTHWLFENADDPASLGLASAGADVTVVPGAGVPASAYPALPQAPPGGPLRVAVVARMLAQKGIRDAVAAAELCRSQGVAVTLELVGEVDPANPSSLSPDELENWTRRGLAQWCGPTDDVGAVWHRNHVALLLSHGGEGLPRALVEAAASARPIVTTDVPGCRDVVRNGREGLLVPPRDPGAAAAALLRLEASPDVRALMGSAARQRFETVLEETHVLRGVEALWRRALVSVPGARLTTAPVPAE